MVKRNKSFERITQCTQINTSNTAMDKNNLDFSGGATQPQYMYEPDFPLSFKQSIDVFADLDLMYSDKVSFNDNEEIENEEINSKNNSANMIPLLND